MLHVCSFHITSPVYTIIILSIWVKCSHLFALFFFNCSAASSALHQQVSSVSPVQHYWCYCKRNRNVSVGAASRAVLAQQLSWKDSDISMHNLLTSLKYLHFAEATFPTGEKVSQIYVYQHLLWFFCCTYAQQANCAHCHMELVCSHPHLLPTATPQLSWMKLNSFCLLSKCSVKPLGSQGSKW